MDQIKGIGLYSKDSPETILIGCQILTVTFCKTEKLQRKIRT